jgi:hypothetical protein
VKLFKELGLYNQKNKKKSKKGVPSVPRYYILLWFYFNDSSYSRSKYSLYNDSDVIWLHPKTKAKVYVGNLTTASSLKLLKKYGITRIINCQDLNSKNWFTKNSKIKHFRFPVALHYIAPFDMKTSKGVFRFFNPLFSWIEKETA